MRRTVMCMCSYSCSFALIISEGHFARKFQQRAHIIARGNGIKTRNKMVKMKEMLFRKRRRIDARDNSNRITVKALRSRCGRPLCAEYLLHIIPTLATSSVPNAEANRSLVEPLTMTTTMVTPTSERFGKTDTFALKRVNGLTSEKRQSEPEEMRRTA